MSIKWSDRRVSFKPGATYTFTRPFSLDLPPDFIVDLNGATVVASGGFSGVALFDATGSDRITLMDSKGTGLIDGNSNAVKGIYSTPATGGLVLSRLRFFETDTNELVGGDRRTMTGGRNRAINCRYDSAKLSFAGVLPEVVDCTFVNSVEQALQVGIPPLAWDDLDRMCANGFRIDRCSFEDCYSSGSGPDDDGVLYMGKDFSGDGTVTDCSFARNKGVSLYLDDIFCNLTARGLSFVDNLGRDFQVGGGRNVHILEATSIDAAYASKWDDRGNKESPMRSPGSPPDGGLPWHGLLHEGTSGVTEWTHGAITELCNQQKLIIVDGYVRDPGAAALLARLNGFGYSDIWTNEAGFRTQGTVDYEYGGTTPAPDFSQVTDDSELVNMVRPAPSG